MSQLAHNSMQVVHFFFFFGKQAIHVEMKKFTRNNFLMVQLQESKPGQLYEEQIYQSNGL